MKNKLKIVIIESVGAILVALIGSFAGRSMEQRNIQNQIDEVLENSINITGGENITINNVADLAEEYLEILESYTASQNNSLVTLVDSTATFENSKIIGYENYNSNDNKDLQNANPLPESFRDEQDDISITVLYQVNPIQSSEKYRNISIAVSTSFSADYVTASIISDENEESQTFFYMYGEDNNWYSNVNLCIDRTYKITIKATGSEKEAIYNADAYVY